MSLEPGKVTCADGDNLSNLSAPRAEADFQLLRVEVDRVLIVDDFSPDGTQVQLVYPFEQSFRGLEVDNDPQASIIKSNLCLLIGAISERAKSFQIDQDKVERVLEELLKNATLYGAKSAEDQCAGEISLLWKFQKLKLPTHDRPDQYGLKLEVTNPCFKLFDPSYYVLMDPEVLANEVEHTSAQGHYGVFYLLASLSPKSKLSYVLNIGEGARVHLEMSVGEAEDIQVEVSRFDSNLQQIAYTKDRFVEDVQAGHAAESVTVSILI